MTEYPASRKQAIEHGSEWYLTGKPCKRGHIALRSVSRKGCIECLRSRDRSPEELARKRHWKEQNPEMQYAYHREHMKRYNRTPEGGKKTRAQKRLRYAVDKGKIDKPTQCSRCGRDNEVIHGHHWDYNKALEVEWVCRTCHLDIHQNEMKEESHV